MNRVAELDALIDELTVDAYNDDEQLAGFHVGADEALRRGERATLAGVEVEVLAVGCGFDARTGLLARVRHDGATREVSLADLAWPVAANAAWWSAPTGVGRAGEICLRRLRSCCLP